MSNPLRRWAESVEGRPQDEPPPGRQEAGGTPAATVILVRDGDDGLETLMLRRNSKLEFAGGMWVFPGGRIDPEDRGDDDVDELVPAARAAAREAQEEAGLALEPTTLVPFSHWEPPAIAPKRFSTWFFLGVAPEGTIEIDHGEIHDHAWLSPRDALARRDALDIELAPPTWVSLFELARFTTTEEALQRVQRWEPERFCTHVALIDRSVVALWHGDAGYETSEADVTGPRHRLWMPDTGPWRYERSD